jgi:hypothetical protein
MLTEQVGMELLGKGGGGLAAGFSGLCNPDISNSTSYSSIHSTYEDVPVYSWSVSVQTHELGHLLGSRHTHACVWNGDGTAIDGCSGFTEGGCDDPGYPDLGVGGTIMSYCHLVGEIGINFSNGFGPQPGSVIRNNVTDAACLTACEGDTVIVTEDTYCESMGLNTSYEWIQAVSVGDLNKISGDNGGYADFTADIMTTVVGADVSVTLTPGFADATYNEAWAIWIDYNQDTTFSVSELVYSGSSAGVLTGSFTVPETALAGDTRMRISMQYLTTPTACEVFTYGEVEDYTVNISDAIDPVVVCASAGENTSYEYIEAVSIGSINNTSGDNGGYGDYFSMTTSESLGSVVAFSLTPGFPGTVYNEFWKIWVDYNSDGDFGDAGEEVYSGSSNGTLTGNFVVPDGAISEPHAMRVSMKYGSAPGPCETFTYGEVEDYTLVTGLETPGYFVLDNNATVKSTEDFTRFEVYPTPSNGQLFVQFHAINESYANIQILDLSGKQVFQNSYSDLESNSKLDLPVQHLANGMYIIKVSSPSSEQSLRIIISN